MQAQDIQNNPDAVPVEIVRNGADAATDAPETPAGDTPVDNTPSKCSAASITYR